MDTARNGLSHPLSATDRQTDRRTDARSCSEICIDGRTDAWETGGPTRDRLGRLLASRYIPGGWGCEGKGLT